MSEAAIIAKGNARSSGYARNDHDWYVEPRYAIEALLDVEAFTGTIWDPACGGGNIPEACRARGLTAWGSDITYRGFGEVRDFLLCAATADNIITNPPFKCAVMFTLRALELSSRKVAILQRTTWLEGEARYKLLFAAGHLQKVWQFRRRISMPPGGSSVAARGGSVAFAWYIFNRQYCGQPRLGWLP